MDDPYEMMRPGERTERRMPSPRARWLGDADGGVQWAIAVMLSVASAATLGALAGQVVCHGSLTQGDVTMLLALHRDATPSGTRLFEVVTLVGSPATIAVVGIIVAVVLLVQKQWILGTGWVAALVGGGAINEVLKYAIRRPRPPYAEVYLSHASFSFPSGHVMGSFVAYGMLAYLVLLWIPRRDVAALVVVVTAALMLAIGFSRLYLGVHYPSDVAGGYAAGGFWLSICVTATDVWHRRFMGRRALTPSSHASVR